MDQPVHEAATHAILGLERQGKPRYLRLRNAVLTVAALLLAAGTYFYLFDRTETARQTFVTQPTTRGDLTVVVSATGSVQPINKVDVSSELSGVVRKVLVDYNSVVQVGDVLAELDTDKLSATVASSRAKVASAKAKVAEADATMAQKFRDYERKRTLAAKEAVSQQDLDTARADYDRAIAALASVRADVGVAEAQLNVDETNLSKSRILSPINGVVLQRNVDPGQTVASSLQAPVLFSLAEDLKQMEIQVDVDEADVGAVAEKQTGSFAVDAYPDRRFPAKIRLLRYGSQVVQGVVTYKAHLVVDNAQLLLRPGMTATATITVKEVKNALLVPNAALRFTPSTGTSSSDRTLLQRLMPRGLPRNSPRQKDAKGPTRIVWVLRGSEAIAMTVLTGVTDGKMTEVTSGELKPGERVIVDIAASRR